MPVSIRQVGPCFAAEVDGIDLTKPLSPEEVAAIHAGMDQYAVLVFHDQHDRRRAAARLHAQPGRRSSTRSAPSLRAPDEYRLPTTFADVSNLDKDNQVVRARRPARGCSRIGNRLWHSDSSFKVIPAKYSLLHARSDPVQGRQHRVRRHARGLRRARRRDQGRWSRT